MVRLLLVCGLLHAAAQTPSAPPAGNASPDAPAGVAADPAAVTFSTELGLLLVAVRPDRAADYEAVIAALQEVLSAATDDRHRAIARSWRVFRVAEADARSNVLYVHIIDRPPEAADYRPSLLLDELLSGAPADLLARYRDAFAGPPTQLALHELANMAVAPVARPANTTPAEPVPPQKPGNTTPHAPR